MTPNATSIRAAASWLSVSLFCLAAPPVAAFPSPGSLIVTKGGTILTLDPTTGNRSELSGATVGSGVAFSSRPVDVVREESGDFVVADFDVQALIRVDGDTGDRTTLASTSVGSGGSFRPTALEIDGDFVVDPANDGSLLVWNTNASAVERVDPVSGDRSVLTSGSVGSGPVLSAVQDMLRLGPGLFSLVDPWIDLVLSDSNLAALLLVSTYTGQRYELSSASVGSGPAFVTPRGIAMIPPPPGGAYPDLYVVDSGLDAIIEVTLDDTGSPTGDRQVVSSTSVGSGPDFDFPYNIWPSPEGGLYVSDFGLSAVFHVDPATGDRTIVADISTGSGPDLAGVRSFTAVPAGGLALGFESETPGSVPDFTILSYPNFGGSVSVEAEAGFVGNAQAAEGNQMLYLTTGPGKRGDPAYHASQSDESIIVAPVWRGQNSPRRLSFAVDYLTDEGPRPDPTEIVALRVAATFQEVIALLSMQTVNTTGPPFGFPGSYSALQDFVDGPITGPDGSVFGEGRQGYKVFEVDVDFPGMGLMLRVADEEDADGDSAVLLDDVRFLPEPGGPAAVSAGGLMIAVLSSWARNRRRRTG